MQTSFTDFIARIFDHQLSHGSVAMQCTPCEMEVFIAVHSTFPREFSGKSIL